MEDGSNFHVASPLFESLQVKDVNYGRWSPLTYDIIPSLSYNSDVDETAPYSNGQYITYLSDP